MRVRELMTEQVLTVGPEAPIKDVARILVENRISGVPVCDIEGKVLGVVSEGDILYKEHDPRDARSGGPLGWIVDGTPSFRGWLKSSALTARKAMTAPALTIAPWDTVAEAARIMCERGVNRLPVVEEGRLVGIVTRSDLVRAFVRSDAEIERELSRDVLERTMWIDDGRIQATVKDGAVRLSGTLQMRSDVKLLQRLVGRVPGVVSIDSSVRWLIDDTARRGRRALEHLAG